MGSQPTVESPRSIAHAGSGRTAVAVGGASPISSARHCRRSEQEATKSPTRPAPSPSGPHSAVPAHIRFWRCRWEANESLQKMLDWYVLDYVQV